jgi:hypothetical protein
MSKVLDKVMAEDEELRKKYGFGFFPSLDELDVLIGVWTRSHYKPGDPVSVYWHPAIQAEAEKMNQEAGFPERGTDDTKEG